MQEGPVDRSVRWGASLWPTDIKEGELEGFRDSYRIPDDIEQKLTQLAESTGRTKSWITNQAIQDYLERELWQINEIKEALSEADAGHFASADDVKSAFSKWGVNAD